MVRRILFALLLGGLLPVAARAQGEGLERHLSRGEGLYRMEKYGEAFMEFEKAGRYAAGADEVFRERLCRLLARSAAQAGMEQAQELLEAYLLRYPAGPGAGEALFELGNLCFVRAYYAAAIEAYAGVDADRLPAGDAAEYYFRYGYACFEQERFETAVRLMAHIDFTSDYYPHAQYVMGYSEYRKGEYRAAKGYFTVIADHPAYSKVLPFYILQIEFNEGNHHYVRENGGAVLRMAAGDRLTELNRIVGESWFYTGGWREARQYLERYRELGGAMDREAYYMLGFSAYMVGDYRDAERNLARAAGPDDKLSQNASYHLADCYLRMGRRQQAMQAFAMASSEGYDEAIGEDALFNYGKLQYELGGGYFNEAINVLNRYLLRYPQSGRVPQVKEYLAAAYYNSRNYDAAYRAIMQVPHPDNDLKAALQKITYFRGLEYYNAGDYDAAERLLGQSLDNRFNAKYTALAGYWQGEILYHRGDMPGAIDRFSAYVRLSPESEPEHLSACYNLGYAYFNLKEWEKAKEWFDEFLLDYRRKDSYAADAYNRRGDIEYSGRSFWRAIEFYDKAAAMNTPERYYSAFQRAMMLGMVQRPERKIESLMEIVRKDEGPYVADAMYELGRAYMGQRRYSEATGVLERFVNTYPMSPRYASALNELGLACQNLGDHARALAYYKRVMQQEKHSEASRSAMTGIRTIYVEENDVDSYFKYAESVGVETDLGEVQRDSLAFAAAQKVYLSGDRVRAAAALDNYVEGYPKGAHVAEALYFAGENALAARNMTDAAGYYRRLTEMPNGDFTVRGLERLSAVCMESGQYGDAADAYLRLSRMATATGKRDEALAGYMKAVTAGGDDARIMAVADDVEARAAGASVKRQAVYAKATALRRMGRGGEALPLYERLGGDVSTPEGAEGAYRVIEAAHAAGDHARVEELVYAFGEKNTPHSYWLGKSFILLGDIYARAGDAFQARATYQSVVDGYPNATDGVVEEAKARIASL